MSELHELLERSTDQIGGPDLGRRALALAHRRRTTRRAVAAVAACVVTVAAVSVGTQVAAGDRDAVPRVAPAAEPTLSDGATPAPAIEQTLWDPREVDELPGAAVEVAPALPEVLAPPDSAVALAEQPIAAAVLVTGRDSQLLLLALDGTWRSIDSPVPTGSVDLSRDGARLGVQTDTGVDVWDLSAGTRSSISLPAGTDPGDEASWTWIDDSTLLFDDHDGGGYRIDADTGAVLDRVAYPSSTSYWWTIDEAGVVVESADFGQPDVLTDWVGGVPRRLDMSSIGRIATPQANADTIAGTTYENRPFSVVVADRDDLSLRAILPIHDPDGDYGNGGLSTVGLLQDATVLLRVAVFGPTPGLRLVAWRPETGELSLVSRTAETPDVERLALYAFARDLLG